MRWRGAEHADSLRDCLERELGERAGFQWLAVAFGAGCLVYFALPREPLLLALLGSSLAAAATATFRYRRGARWRIAGVVALCLAGATAGKLRVDSIAGPQIEREFSATLSGRVVDRESRTERRPRIVLDRLGSEADLPDRLPSRIRLTIGEKYGLPPLGARISVRARLMPVPGPAVPGGYDPRRAAFFEGIGGSGFVLGGWRMLEPPANSAGLLVARLRAAIVARIMTAAPGETGAVAAALLVGERSGLSAETNESLRLSGLAHILSISGLHMMLIAGTAFFGVRAVLRCRRGSPSPGRSANGPPSRRCWW
jgi:competence protein ComEC